MLWNWLYCLWIMWQMEQQRSSIYDLELEYYFESVCTHMCNSFKLSVNRRKVLSLIFNSVQFSCSVVSDSLWPHGLQPARPPCPSPTPGVYSNSYALSWWCYPTCCILRRPLFLLPSIFPNNRVFSNESVLCIRWTKYWSFNFSISLSNEYLGLISFRMDWLDLLAVQGTLKSLLQLHSSKASILLCSAFFIVQLSHPYMTTRKTIALTRWTFVGKVMSLLFNKLSRLVITFLSRSKHLLISWLQSITICSDFGAPKHKVCHYYHCFPTCLPRSDGTRCHDLSFLNIEF